MGAVYRARDERLGRFVALKIVRSGAGSLPRPETTARFLREGRAAAALTHPHVVAIYDVGEDDGVPWLAMELVEGASLRQQIAGDATIAQRVRWLREIAEALGAAHAIGIVHRDMKPDNVMIGSDGRAKVLDFGLARAATNLDPPGPDALTASPELGAITRDGAVIGTPAYMAPEQIRGEAVDGRCDQFAWGVTAFEVLSGRLPWPTGLEALGTMAHVLTKDAHPLAVDGVAPWVAGAIGRALAKDANDRFGSMAELLAAFDGAPSTVDAPPTPASTTPAPTPLESADTAVSGREEVDAALGGPALAPTVEAVTLSSSVATSESREDTVVSSPSTSRRVWWVLGGVLVTTGLALGVLRPDDAVEGAAPAPAPSASAAPARETFTIPTAPPPASTTNGPAVAEYRAGRQRQHECDWTRARPHFDRAAALAPDFAEAHFQIAVQEYHMGWLTVSEAVRASYRRAVDGRARMSERDRALVEAYEPALAREPPDLLKSVDRFRALVEARPRDAEIQLRYAAMVLALGGALESTEPNVRAACELDPAYADAWQMRIQVEAASNRIDGALEAAEECRRLAPNSKECAATAAKVLAYAGRCAEAERESRAAAGTPLDGWQGVYLLALGRSPAQVGPAFERAWGTYPEELRPRYEAIDRYIMAMAGGDFSAAREHGHRILTAARTADAQPEQSRWAGLACIAAAAHEAGALRSEAELLRGELESASAWQSEATMIVNASPLTWDLLRRNGLATDEEVARARDAARVRHADEMMRAPTVGWVAVECAGVTTEAEARAAVARMPPRPNPAELLAVSTLLADAGHVLLLAGDPEAAIPWLRRGTESCLAWSQPHPWVEGHVWLGDALVRTGRRDEACEKYGFVIDRWGPARPRSVTADLARKRAAAAGCPPR
jgi:serine/threonine protein kinase/tetratricopeptide (TPR) repeat protein